jgi:hypothetical protein
VRHVSDFFQLISSAEISELKARVPIANIPHQGAAKWHQLKAKIPLRTILARMQIKFPSWQSQSMAVL